MEKAAKAEAKLKRLCDGIGISTEGREWMDVCLDPFKDIEQHPAGYPDKQMARSCVQVIHDTLTLTAPSSAGSGNWDCNVFLDTLWESIALYDTQMAGNTYLQSFQNANGFNRGGLVVRAGPQGAALTMPTTQNASCRSLVTDVFQNGTPSRLLGIGFEVHDTTQELKKQGAVICYRVSDDNSDNIYTVAKDGATAVIPSSGLGTVLPEPPTTSGQAIDLPLSQEWKAPDGVYVVPVLNTTTNPPDEPHLFGATSHDSTNTSNVYNYFPKIYTSSSIYLLQDSNLKTPFSLSGAYFTGLDPAAVLVVNLCYYVEQFPAYLSPLHRLTNKGCPLDNGALEFYTKIARVIPVGVPVNDNFLGAFISGIANIARTVAPHIGTALRVGGALAQALGPPMGGGERGLSNLARGSDFRPSNVLTSNEITTLPSSTASSGTRGGLAVHSSERNSIVPIRTNNNRAIVPYTPLLDQLWPAQRREVEREVVREIKDNNPKIVVRNKRNKKYNRTEELVKKATMPNAGNKWAGQ